MSIFGTRLSREELHDLRGFAIDYLQILNERTKLMAKTLDEMIALANNTLTQIQKNTDLDDSIIALVTANAATIADLRQQLAQAGTDPVKLAQLGDLMDQVAAKAVAEGQKAADAVTANTKEAPARTPQEDRSPPSTPTPPVQSASG